MAKKSATPGSLVDLWVLGRVSGGNITRSTGRTERWTVLAFLEAARSPALDEIDHRTVQAWLDGASHLKRETRVENLRVVRRFFDHLVDAGAIAQNPARAASVPRAPKIPALRRYGPLPRAVDDVVLEYLMALERRGLRDATINARRLQLARLTKALGKGPLDATPTDLAHYLDALRGHGIEYRYSQVSALRSFYRWAVVEEYLGRDPTVRLPLPRRRPGLPRPMPDADVRMALDMATTTPLRQWMHLAAFAGLRASEIARVRREEIVDARDGSNLIVEGKGGRTRAVPLAAELDVLLRAPELPSAGYLFVQAHDPQRPISPGQVSKRANAFLHDLGIAHSLHSLRHFYGTMLYERTENLRLVQERMGHATPIVTAGYTKVTALEGAEAIRDLPRWWRDGRVTS